MSFPVRPRPVVLCVLDGWGHREGAEDNALSCARAPVFQRLWSECPHALLEASEQHVGLPAGQMGNSEVGHMNLGAGRVIFQDLPRIDRAFLREEVEAATAFRDLVTRLKDSGGTCHIIGLASPGGVHAHQDHMAKLAALLAARGIPVAVHAFLDGRDTPPQSASGQIKTLASALGSLGNTRLATLCGRYYAMDRDKRWERVELAYNLLVAGEGAAFDDPQAAIAASYAAGVTDEFLKPVALNGYAGIKDGDGILFANFRADRAREILAAILDPAFGGFVRKKTVRIAAAVGMVEYSSALNVLMTTLFPPQTITDSFGEILARHGLKQLRIAETEKYAHVTFFFNGGREEPYAGEERIVVPSPKVATYDLQPEMSAREVTDKVVEAVDSGRFDAIVLNYANPDMVGHTGVLEAAIRAVEALDACLGRLVAAVERQGGCLLITADHGNCERMRDPVTGQPHTAHTLERVPVILVNGPAWAKGLRDGKLADVAPTLLEIMGLPQPSVMDGQSLIAR